MSLKSLTHNAIRIFIFLIFTFLFIISCKTKEYNSLTKKKHIIELNYSEINWGNCSSYLQSFSDENIVLKYLGKKQHFNFDGPIYTKFNCKDTLLLKINNKPLNGIYKIININNQWNRYSPYIIIANFKNGKRNGIWKYYNNDDFYNLNNNNIIIGLTGNKKYKLIIKPIKLEYYKNGLPNGKWLQKLEYKTEYFIYKNGKLINKYSKKEN